MRRSLLALIPALWAATAAAAPVGKTVEYRAGDATLEGYLAYDGATAGKRPGILIVPEQGGPNARLKAEQWAKQGYVAFATAPIGRGVRPAANDPAALRARLEAGLAVLAKQPQVDDHWLAAVGYGAGGPAALELAYAGADLDGVVCVHGEPDAPDAAEAKKVRGKVLVLLGDRAPAAARGFEEALRKAGVEVRVLRPAEGPAGPERVAQLDARAFEAARSFCEDLFPKKAAGRPPAGAAPAGVPAKVMTVLKHVDDQGEAPKGYEGGRTFGNFEGHLPKRDASGRAVKYREWDVNALQAGVNRGAERLVTGSDGSAYYSDDHYRTFKKIR